jgi:uncharacterized integral membrane protein
MTGIVLVVAIILLVTLFSVQNALPVSISFLFWQFNASLAIIALLFFLSGMIVGMGSLTWLRMRRNAKKKKEAGLKPANHDETIPYQERNR